MDPRLYACERLWATAADGVRVPVSVMYREDLVSTYRAGFPTLLYGYGAYGESTDAAWDAERLSLVDSGVLHAIAHVRGGGEMGVGWHEAGRCGTKPNSFGDMISCAEVLISRGLADPRAVALEGRSAGGLLVGATANLRPELFCALVASVPFLDAAGTLQDSSLPLTANEWEEFGNPNEADGFENVFGFSPVHNVKPRVKYPKCLLLPALNDARTGFWEAPKFADRIRSNGYAQAAPSHTELRKERVHTHQDEGEGEEQPQQWQQPQQPDQLEPRQRERQQHVLVHTDMAGGHFRSDIPRERARQRSIELGFLIHALQEAMRD